MNQELDALISSIPMLCDLSDTARKRIAASSSTIQVKSGAKLLPLGSRADGIFFVLKGSLKVCHVTSDGKEALIGLVQTGGHIGLVALVSGVPRSTDIVAISACTLLKIEGEVFKELLEAEPKLCYELLSSLAIRLEQTSRHFVQQSLLSLPHRVFARLLELAEPHSLDGEDILIVRELPTHQHIAGLVGASREAVTRALKSLEHDGNIQIIDSQVSIISIPELN